MSDVIEGLAGLAPGSSIAELRARRPQARENAQASYRALFDPPEPGPFSRAERLAVAFFVADLHADAPASAHYRARLSAEAPVLVDVIEREAGRGRTRGPYGRYRAGPLSREDLDGPVFAATQRAVLGERLAAALDHAHLLVFRPREASAAALRPLAAAGWTTAGIVTLSQLVAFLAFQIRAAAGLRVLAAAAA